MTMSRDPRQIASDTALDRWLLTHVSTTHHVAGTCKIGPATDAMAVVDQYCRVHGLEVREDLAQRVSRHLDLVETAGVGT